MTWSSWTVRCLKWMDSRRLASFAIAPQRVLDHEIPVVAMTANAFPEDRARAIAAGMNDFLAKPVDRSVLADMLEKWRRPAPGNAPRAAAG